MAIENGDSKTSMESEKNIDTPVAKRVCCGCTACFSICPKRAIIMINDEYEMKYPTINEEICICCDLCKKVCPIKHYQFL